MLERMELLGGPHGMYGTVFGKGLRQKAGGREEGNARGREGEGGGAGGGGRRLCARDYFASVLYRSRCRRVGRGGGDCES